MTTEELAQVEKLVSLAQPERADDGDMSFTIPVRASDLKLLARRIRDLEGAAEPQADEGPSQDDDEAL